MRPDDTPLARVERRWLEEHVIGDADLAEVVQCRSALDRFDITCGQLHRMRDHAAILGERILRFFAEAFDLARGTGGKRNERCEDQPDDDERDQIDLIALFVVLAAHLIERVIDRKDVSGFSAAYEWCILRTRVRTGSNDLEFIERQRMLDVIDVGPRDLRIYSRTVGGINP